MKIATYNGNGIIGGPPIPLRRVEEGQAYILCFRKLNSIDAKFSRMELGRAGCGAISNAQKRWNGVVILLKGSEPRRTRRGIAGDPGGSQRRYIEAIVDGVAVGGLYHAKHNPVPGLKFDDKLKWFKRFQPYADDVLQLGAFAILVGDFNAISTDLDVDKPGIRRDDGRFRREVRKADAEHLSQEWTDAIRRLHPDQRIDTFWRDWRKPFERDAALRIDHVPFSGWVAPWLPSGGVGRKLPRGVHMTGPRACHDRVGASTRRGPSLKRAGGPGNDGCAIHRVRGGFWRSSNLHVLDEMYDCLVHARIDARRAVKDAGADKTRFEKRDLEWTRRRSGSVGGARSGGQMRSRIQPS
ncbi:endonuclease/exonuclease/phosphatase family protein [Rhizobium sp. L74/93]